MTARELLELETAARQGALTQKEQERVCRELRETMQRYADLYVILSDIKREIAEAIGDCRAGIVGEELEEVEHGDD